MNRQIFSLLFSAAWFASLAAAQTTTGSLTGTVTDPTGAAVAGAKITATNAGTGVVNSAVSNGVGV